MMEGLFGAKVPPSREQSRVVMVFQIKVKNFRLREWFTDTTIGQIAFDHIHR